MTSTGQRPRPDPLRQLVKRAMTAVLPRRALLCSGPHDSGCVCLTFDDGPHPEHTPALLDALARASVRGTFFVVGARAAAHPELVRRIARAGHLVGNHSYDHGAPEHTSTRKLLAEVRQTSALLEEVLGRPPHLFRPPHGKLTPGKLLGLWRQRQTVVLWSHDPKDFVQPTAPALLGRFQACAPRSGDIVLLHDTCPHTPLILGELARRIRAAGLDLDRVDRWL